MRKRRHGSGAGTTAAECKKVKRVACSAGHSPDRQLRWMRRRIGATAFLGEQAAHPVQSPTIALLMAEQVWHTVSAVLPL